MKYNKTLGCIFFITIAIVFYFADKEKDMISNLQADIEYACMELHALTEKYPSNKEIKQWNKDICYK